ncbi:MAG TPA: hypothetical protein VNA69_21500 [Thermoanaerobaculia bacterium]|nr:hypothetical protein [Thermoanaerobaculia bacterium]
MKRSLLLVVLLFACRETDPIAGAVDKVVDAAEDRDASAVMEQVSSTYEGRADIEQTLRQYFFAYRAIEVSITDLQTRSDEKEGWASFRVNFTGVPKEIGGIAEMVPRAAKYQFQVWLVQEGGEWKIADARWEQVPAP